MTELSRRAFAGGVASLAALPSEAIDPPLRLPPSDTPRVALTLDACPGAFDLRLAQALVDAQIPATIFLTALWIRQNQSGLDFLLSHRDLFALQNHGALHRPAVLGNRFFFGLRPAGTWDGIRAEIDGGSDAVQAATGEKPIWYRAAGARYSPEVLAPIRQMGVGIAGYSLNADQGASLPAGAVAARMAKATDGDVIIGHINQPFRPSGAGIAAGATALKRQGMRFVHLPAHEPPGT